LSKDLDGRKKFSKLLQDKAAVVPCEEVAEADREAWIQYLAQKRGQTLPGEVVARLSTQDPWSLDLMDLELEKYEGARKVLSEQEALGVLRDAGVGGADLFVEAFFSRNTRKAMEGVEELAQSPEVAIPLLGLMAWNARHLCQLLAENRAGGGAATRLNPYLMERFRRWMRSWSLEEALDLQEALGEVDFGTKQTPRLPLGLWSSLVQRYRQENS
jgi:DNA polymerase III delta subunit